jgi:hypothetical protein
MTAIRHCRYQAATYAFAALGKVGAPLLSALRIANSWHVLSFASKYVS